MGTTSSSSPPKKNMIKMHKKQPMSLKKTDKIRNDGLTIYVIYGMVSTEINE